MTRALRRTIAATSAAALAATLSACTMFGPAPTPSGATASARADREEVLVKLGTLLPMTGPNAEAADSTRAAVRLAVREVNDAGLGIRLEVVDADAGTPGDGGVAAAVQQLIDADVDAVIGPRSSAQSLEAYRMLADAGIVEISPASTLPELGEVPDDGYFFRTVPSDDLQSQILGSRILFDGATTIGIIRVADAYGEPLAAGLAATFADAGAAVTADVVVEPGAEDAAVAELLAGAPEAIVVISSAIAFDPIAAALAANAVDWARVYGTDASLEAYRGRSDASIAGAVFSSPGVLADRDFVTALRSIDPSVRLVNFAPEAYDAVVLVALAALQAGSNEGSAIRDHLIPVSGGPGELVQTFAEGARRILDGDGVDYDGLSGPLDFAANGDVGQGFISFYRYDGEGEPVWIDQAFGRLDVH